MKKFNIRVIVILGLFIALHMIASRFLAINMPTIRISIAAIFIILPAVWFGPAAGVLVGGISDILGCAFTGGWYPVLTLSPILLGLLVGMHRNWIMENPNTLRFAAVIGMATVVTTLGVTTWGLYLLYGDAFLPLFVSRIPQTVISLIVNIKLAQILHKRSGALVKQYVFNGVNS